MLIKLCYNNETHLISKVPKSFQDLLSLISASFQDKLPVSIDIHYTDSDGDKVMIACDQDLEAMFAIEGHSDHTLKIQISASKIQEYVPSLENSNIIIEKEKCNVNEMTEKLIDLKVSDPKPSVTVKNFEPFKEVKEQPKEPFVSKKEIGAVCRKCLGSGFNIKKNKQCKKCEGKGVAKEENCRKCNGTGFNAKKGKPCKRCDGKGKRLFRCKSKEWKEKRMSKLKSLIDEQVNISIDRLREELNLKKSREEFLQQKPNIEPETRKKVHQEGPTSVAIHEQYTCDGCGVHPILGTRYKCSVCRNFDYCEACEANIEHEHAFLKIRHPKQAPRMIFTALEEIPQTLLNFFKAAEPKEKKPAPSQEESKGTNTEEQPQHIYKELDLSFSEGINEEFPRIFEKKPEQKPEPKVLSFEVKKLKVLPELILEGTNFVFVSFVVRNTGKLWPEGLRLDNISKNIKCDALALPALNSEEEISLTLVVENPKSIGKHQLVMEMVALEHESKTLTFDFEVLGVPSKNNNSPVKPETMVPQPEEKKPLKKINEESLKKAESLREIFGGDVEDYIDICEKFKDVAIDNLAEQVLNDRLLMEKFSRMNM